MAPRALERLIRREPESPPQPGPLGPLGVVLMLHGGAQVGVGPVDSRSLSYRRARAMFETLAPGLTGEGYAVWLLRFSVKGWNASPTGDPAPSPVPDARWALEQVHQAHPGVPVVLLGHSMGARTAAYVADDPAVTGMVGLAPWLQPEDPVAGLAGKDLVTAHGRRDRITSARQTRDFVRRAETARRPARSAEFVDMGLVGHYMLTHVGRWNDVALTRTLDLLRRGEQRRTA